METKHTKGPWATSNTINDIAIYHEKNDGDIALVYKDSRATPQHEAEANAKLIAASPELLEANEQSKEKLHHILQEWSNGNFPLPKSVADRIGAISEILEDAIRKATT